VVEFFLKYAPEDSLGKWRLVVEARFSSDDPRGTLEAARRSLRAVAGELDHLLSPPSVVTAPSQDASPRPAPSLLSGKCAP